MDQELFEKLLETTIWYCIESGNLYWKERKFEDLEKFGFSNKGIKRFNLLYSGKPITNKNNYGYIQVSFTINYKGYAKTAHQVAWFLHYGEWSNLIDHINGIKTDNRLCNLRSTNHTMNLFNASVRSDNSSGTTGVSFKKDKLKWKAYYNYKGKQYHIGYFNTKEEAINARKLWEESSGYIFVNK